MQFPDSENVQYNFGIVQIPRLRGAHNICKLMFGLGSESSGTVRVLVQIYSWVQRVMRLKVFIATLVIKRPTTMMSLVSAVSSSQRHFKLLPCYF